MSLPGSASPPAVDYRREVFARESGVRAGGIVAEGGPLPREILTKQAFENAIAVVMALAGSTNAVLHLLAIAREAHVDLQLDDFDRIGRTVPHLVDVRPAGTVRDERHRSRGRRARSIMKELLDAGHLHGDCLTVTGRTLAENLAAMDVAGARRRRRAPAARPDPPVGRARDPARQPRPRRRRDEGRGRRGPRLPGDGPPVRLREGRVRRADLRARSTPGDVIVIRYEGPKGSPGMPEMLAVTAAVAGAGLGQGRRADHRRPVQRRHEGLQRGPHRAGGVRGRTDRARGRRRPRSVIDADARTIELLVDDADARGAPGARGRQPEPRYTQGALAKYARMVGSADHGAVTW